MLTLKVTPQINEGDALILDIQLENSNLQASSQGAVDLITNERTITQKVLVENGQVLAIPAAAMRLLVYVLSEMADGQQAVAGMLGQELSHRDQCGPRIQLPGAGPRQPSSKNYNNDSSTVIGGRVPEVGAFLFLLSKYKEVSFELSSRYKLFGPGDI